MAEALLLKPDRKFVEEVIAAGGGRPPEVLPVRYLFGGLWPFQRLQPLPQEGNGLGPMGT